jgi:hypothetical protein
MLTFGQGRVVINEFMPWSGCSTTSEYIELLNFGPGPMDIGCFIVTNGQYAVTIPANTILQPGQYYVLAGQNVLPVDCGNIDSAINVNLNWTTCNCTDKPVPTTGDGFLQNGGGANEKVVLLNPSLMVVDAVSRSIPVSSSVSITTSSNGGTCTPTTFDLDLFMINYESISTATGIDNSYSRRVDGDCGWVKTTNISAGAPNKTGSTASASYSFSTLSASQCNGTTGTISIAVSAADVPSLFPMTYTLAFDKDSNSIFDNTDIYTFGVDSTASSIDISNLAYGRYRITVGSSSGCNLQSYDFFIFNCYGVVLPYNVVSFNYSGLMDNKRWFNAEVTGMDHLNSIILEAKVGAAYKAINTINITPSNVNIKNVKLSAPLSSSEKYRLLLISNSNTVYYSNEIIIRDASVEQVQLWPNPTKNEIYVSVPFKQSTYISTIFNSIGEVVYKEKHNVRSSNKLNRIPTANLPKGVYALLITSECSDYRHSIRFIKE